MDVNWWCIFLNPIDEYHFYFCKEQLNEILQTISDRK